MKKSFHYAFRKVSPTLIVAECLAILSVFFLAYVILIFGKAIV